MDPFRPMIRHIIVIIDIYCLFVVDQIWMKGTVHSGIELPRSISS